MLKQILILKMEKVLEKWLFPKNTPNVTLDALYLHFKSMDFTPIIKAFTDRLQNVDYKFSKSEQVSGSICFFGGVFTSLLNYGYIENIEGLFTFALCYMLIDHFLDDDTISKAEKTKCMNEVYLFMSTGERSDNKLVNAAADRYLKLVAEVPECQEYILKLFKSELEGVKVQSRKDLPREVYLKIAEEKGGYTAAVIGSIIGLDGEDEKKESYRLGSLIQSPCDDLLDKNDDALLSIYTLVRYDIDHGVLDSYIRESIIKIDELSNIYNFFKPILLLGIILGIHDNPGCINSQLDELLQKYNPFDKNTSKITLIEWFHEKLYKYIDENMEVNL